MAAVDSLAGETGQWAILSCMDIRDPGMLILIACKGYIFPRGLREAGVCRMRFPRSQRGWRDRTPRTDAEDDSSEVPRRLDRHHKYLDMEQDSFSFLGRLGFAAWDSRGLREAAERNPRTDGVDDSSEVPGRLDGHRKYLDMEQDSFSFAGRLGFAG